MNLCGKILRIVAAGVQKFRPIVRDRAAHRDCFEISLGVHE